MKTPVLESLFNNAAKKRLQRRCFHVNIAKFLGISFFTEHLPITIWPLTIWKQCYELFLYVKISKNFCSSPIKISKIFMVIFTCFRLSFSAKILIYSMFWINKLSVLKCLEVLNFYSINQINHIIL